MRPKPQPPNQMSMISLLTTCRRALVAGMLLGALSFQPNVKAQTPTVVWQQLINYSDFSDWGPSSTPPASEIADDFDVVGTITRIDVNGYGAYTGDAGFSGVYVRFYAYGADRSEEHTSELQSRF